ncbi:MAG: hypothetical protein ACYSYV_00045 [Planctomycetota bacterium]
MWPEETDIAEALDEHDFESESADDFYDLELDSDIAEDTEAEDTQEDSFGEDSAYVDYEG